jgi:hypothetical protein
VTAGVRERIPQPQAVDGVVDIDIATRTLIVRRSELANGYTRLLWREAHRALVADEETGWRNAQPVWASTVGAGDRIAYAVPGDGLALKFRFPPTADSAYTKLISRPGLAAVVTIDRGTCRFLRVGFTNRG